MLQMAAQAAVTERKSSRSVANSTSTLWPPYAAPDQPKEVASSPNTVPLHAPSASLLPFQPEHAAERTRQAEGSMSHMGLQQDVRQEDNGNGIKGAGPSSARPSANAAEAETAVSALSSSRQADDSRQHAKPSDSVVIDGERDSMQKPSQQLKHHDASQPWGTSWKQPTVALQLPPGQSALSKVPSGLNQTRRSTVPDMLTKHSGAVASAAEADTDQSEYQLRRSTVAEVATEQPQHQRRRDSMADVPMADSRQQQGVRQSSRLQAARSLSWSHQPAESPQLHQRSSGNYQHTDTIPVSHTQLQKFRRTCFNFYIKAHTLLQLKLELGTSQCAGLLPK